MRKLLARNKLFVAIFIVSAIVFIIHFFIVGSGVWGDGRFYFSYLHSWIVDFDLNFGNEFAHFNIPIEITQTGFIANKFPIGSAIIWLPFYLTLYLILSLGHIIISGLDISGYSNIYQITIGLNSVLLGIIGLFFCRQTLKQFFPDRLATISVLAIWLASNLFFYTAIDPINSHSVSFFLFSILFYLLIVFKKNFDWLKALIVGVLLGLLAMTRTEDGVFVIPVLFYLFLNKKNLLEYIKNLIIISGSFFVAFLPQIIIWQMVYGQIQSPYIINGETFNWLTPGLINVLINQQSGLFTFAPILIFSTIGLFLILKKDIYLAITAILLFLFQWYIVSSWYAQTGTGAYGARMFVSLMPIFMLGIGEFTQRLSGIGRKIEDLKPSKLGISWHIVQIGFVILNFYSIVTFLLSS